MQNLIPSVWRMAASRALQRLGIKLIQLVLASVLPFSSAWALYVPPGGTITLGGGSIDMTGVDVEIHGELTLISNSHIIGVRSVTIFPGGQLNLSGSTIELYEQYSNNGTVIANGGNIIRVAGGAGNPSAGPLGPLSPQTGSVLTATPVPTMTGWSLLLLSIIVGLLSRLRIPGWPRLK